MSENTKIEWADHTFNPWIGCQKVSPACDHCYAEAWDRRFAVSGHAMRWGEKAQRTRTSAANWRLPLKWNKQAQAEGRRFKVFCASLADVFDNQVPQAWRDDLFTLIEATPHLDWLLLTKRIGNVANMLPVPFDFARLYPNVWLGATICNQAEADRDIPKLLALPARVRFLSIEPMLGPILLPGLNPRTAWCPQCKAIVHDGPNRPHELVHRNVDFGAPFDPERCCSMVYDMLHWVICGGESGPGARPMHPAWARSLRDQCAAAGVPFLFKQWGEHTAGEPTTEKCHPGDTSAWRRDQRGQAWNDPYEAGKPMSEWAPIKFLRVGKKAAGRLLDGIEHNGFPEVLP